MPRRPTALLDLLRKLDTPTICNALEVACPERRTYGFTTEPLICPFPDLPPIVGFARTSTMRSVEAASGSGEEQRKKIFGYYDYVSSGSGATHRGHPGHRRGPRRLGGALGRGQQRHPQGAGLPGRGHQRLGARHPASGARVPVHRRAHHAIAHPRQAGGFRPGGERRRHGRAHRRPDPCRPPRRGGDPARQGAGGARCRGSLHTAREGDPRYLPRQGVQRSTSSRRRSATPTRSTKPC